MGGSASCIHQNFEKTFFFQTYFSHNQQIVDLLLKRLCWINSRKFSCFVKSSTNGDGYQVVKIIIE